jgi:hypothetical protein
MSVAAEANEMGAGRESVANRRWWGCLALTLAFGVAAALPASSAGTDAPPILCKHSNIDGDHLTAANQFTVRGVPCSYALFAAVGLTDGTERYNVDPPSTVRFTASGSGGSYRWTCRTTALRHPHVAKPGESGTNPEEPGIDYHCRGHGHLTGHGAGEASMDFKWWLIGVRECTAFALESRRAVVTEATVTRNVACEAAEHWIRTATREIERFGHPYRVQDEARYYRYYDSGGVNGSDAPGDGRLYMCLAIADRELRNVHGTSTWICRPPGHPFAGREYQWIRHQPGTR